VLALGDVGLEGTGVGGAVGLPWEAGSSGGLLLALDMAADASEWETAEGRLDGLVPWGAAAGLR